MNAINFYGDIVDGKLKLHQPKTYHRLIKSMKGLVKISVKEAKSVRTLSQNNGYWFKLTIFAGEVGCTAMELHEVFKREFLKKIITKKNIKTGKIDFITIGGSTTTLSTNEFGRYMDKIDQRAAEYGIILELEKQ